MFRMAVLYVVTAWLVMQVAEVLVGLGNLPAWIGPTVLGILAIGFPIAMLLSWFYEITPEGISLEKHVEPGASITHITGRRIDFIVIAVLCAALVVFTHDRWWPAGPSARSIAVLPFENQSPDNESVGFLATGIQDGLLTRLSKSDTLKVISRTSVERYRNTSDSVPRIAAELGVRMILEGAVQRAGDQIRVNVQLIDAMTDEHVWAETYDRVLSASNIFMLQSEIVGTIARQLDANLVPDASSKADGMPTQNLAAYTEYLRGMKQTDIESVESMHAAIEHFEAAAELDPDFALAYVGLADAYLGLGAYFVGGLPIDESIALAEPPLMRALELDTDLVEAQASLGLLRALQGDIEAAERAFDKAIAMRPNYARVFRRYGKLRYNQGRNDEAIQFLEKAYALDPYSVPINFEVARLYEGSGRFEEAMEHFLRVVEIEPKHAFAYVYIAAIHYLAYGRVDESLIWYFKAAENDARSPSLQAGQAIAYLEIDDPDSARPWVDKALELGPETFWAVWSSALLNLYVGDEAAAQEDARTLLQHYPRNWGALRILRDADIAAGRHEVARSRYARAHRELTGPDIPVVNGWNYFAAIDLAPVLLQLGETERATDMLEGALKVMKTRPRLGIAGYWINDARAYAVQGNSEKALDALRTAVDAGWRLHTWYHLDLDPNLESIRGTPEFAEINALVKADLEQQAERVRELEASGELASSRPTGPDLE